MYNFCPPFNRLIRPQRRVDSAGTPIEPDRVRDRTRGGSIAHLCWREREKEWILGSRYSRRDPRNHFHRFSFADGKITVRALKTDVDPDVMGRSNYSEVENRL